VVASAWDAGSGSPHRDELYRDGASVAVGESTIGYQQANDLLSKED
jgi:hypothetical protein